jgi:hypothetical protein
MSLRTYLAKVGVLSVAGFSLLTNMAVAHDVSASSVTVHVDGKKVEILQTTPVETAAEIASSLSKSKLSADDENEILTALSGSWKITGKNSACKLERQAYRLQHHGVEIQLRYLYVCDGSETPEVLEATWLEKTPSEHFLIFTINADKKSKTVIFEHQKLTIDISDLT